MDEIISNAFRSVLWAITRFALVVCDSIYSVIVQFTGLKVGDFAIVWDFYKIVVAATGMFLLARIVIILIKSFWDDNTIQKITGPELVNRILAVALVLSLVPVIMPLLSDFTAASATAIPTIVTDTEDIKPSDILVEAGLSDFSNELSSTLTLELAAGQHAIDVITVSTINNTTGDVYDYFPEIENIILTLVLAIMCAYCYVYIAIQIIQRLVGLLLKIIIAPYPLSGIIDPNDNAPSLWFRLCISDFLAAYFQMMTLWLAMAVATSLPDSFSGIAKGLAFIGAIFSIMIAPSGIAQLLGNDTGAQAGMQMMQSAMMLFHSAQTALSLSGSALRTASTVVRATGNAATNVGATGIYSIGRRLGGRSMNPTDVNTPTTTLSGGTGGYGGNSGVAEPMSRFNNSSNPTSIGGAPVSSMRTNTSGAGGHRNPARSSVRAGSNVPTGTSSGPVYSSGTGTYSSGETDTVLNTSYPVGAMPTGSSSNALDSNDYYSNSSDSVGSASGAAYPFATMPAGMNYDAVDSLNSSVDGQNEEVSGTSYPFSVSSSQSDYGSISGVYEPSGGGTIDPLYDDYTQPTYKTGGGTQSTGSGNGGNGGRAGASADVASVSSKGYVVYSDGRVTEPNSFLGRVSAPTSIAGGVAQTFARHVYQSAGARVTHNAAERQQIRANKSVQTKAHEFTDSLHEYKQNASASYQRGAEKKVDNLMNDKKTLARMEQLYKERQV